MNKLIYNNFMPNAENECTAPSSNDDFMKPGAILKEELPSVLHFATLEGRGIALKDYSLCFARNNNECCYVSSKVSGSASAFTDSVKLTIQTKSGYGFARGITLAFHEHYCTELDIFAYYGDSIVASGSFAPNELTFYCDLQIEKFSKIEIEFKKTQTPYQLVKVESIRLGKQEEITEFFGEIEIFNEISVDCSDLPGSTCSLQAHFGSEKPVEGQRFTVEHNGEVFGSFSIESSNETQDGIYSIEAVDDNFLLEEIPMPQAVSGSLTVSDFREMLARVGIELAGSAFDTVTLTGTVAADGKTTLRQLAAMVSFGTGAYFSSARNKKLCLKKPQELNIVISSDRIIGKPSYTAKIPYSKITIKTDSQTYSATDSERAAGQAANELVFDKYKLFSDAEATLEEIVSRGWQRNEINATIVLRSEKVGDIVKIETKKNGVKRGVIRSMAIYLRRNSAVAEVTLTELPEEVATNG